MKNKIYSLLAALITLVAFTGCDDWNPADKRFPSNTGGVSLGSMALTVSETAQSVVSRAQGDVDTSGFLVTITDATGATVSYDGQECSWTYGKMPEVMTLPVADGYTVNVRSHVPEKAAWDTPYFEGSKAFDVKDGEITAIGTVKCLYAAIKVSVIFEQSLAASMSADSKVDVVAGEDGLLTWNASETRAGHFEYVDGSNTLVATFTGKINGQDITAFKEFKDVEKGKYYIITFKKVQGNPNIPDEWGNINPEGITIDTSVEEEDISGNVENPQGPTTGDRPDDEEWPEPGPGPDEPGPGPDEPGTDPITTEGIDENAWNPVIEGKEYLLKITSEKPLAHLNVEIISDYLTADFLESVNLTDKFDLAYPGQYAEALGPTNDEGVGFGFPIGDQVIGQTYVEFNLSPFIPLLALGINNDPPVYKHTFKLTIVDQEGNEKIVELKFDTSL